MVQPAVNCRCPPLGQPATIGHDSPAPPPPPDRPLPRRHRRRHPPRPRPAVLRFPFRQPRPPQLWCPYTRKSTLCPKLSGQTIGAAAEKPRDRAPKGRALGVGIPRHARRRNAGLLRHVGRPLPQPCQGVTSASPRSPRAARGEGKKRSWSGTYYETLRNASAT